MAARSDIYARLRDKARGLLPESKGPVHTCIFLGTLADAENILGSLDDEDFLWLNCKPTTRVSSIHKNVSTAIMESLQEARDGFHFTCNGAGLRPDSTLGTEVDLEQFDNFVLLIPSAGEGDHAVLRSSTPNIQAASRMASSSTPHVKAENGVKSEPKDPENISPFALVDRNGTVEQSAAVARCSQSQTPVGNLEAPTASNPVQSAGGSAMAARSVSQSQTPVRSVDPMVPAQSGGTAAEHTPTPEPSIQPVAAAPVSIKREHLSEKQSIADPLPDNEDEKPVQAQLQGRFETADIATMEAGIKAGVALLDKLKDSLTTEHESEDAAMWLEQIGRIRAQAEYHRTIVGVVGNTGAGKSSVINAILDEERVIPTNCMRACTAVVTEISYNNETEDPYRAEIEFITKEDWAKELRVLFQDLIDNSGEVRRLSADSEASIAWDKIKAVYPKKTKEEIAKSSVEQLLRDPIVDNVLGKTRMIHETDPLRFYKKLQKFVDSQEKSTGKKDDKRPKESEYWPLIRVVKLGLKSPVLETGAVLVDLPGVHDANAARAAVAEDYMKQCTGIFITAPITRAVDDRTAHRLLGEGFRRQLLMDGGFNSISFVCSKTDDISVSEAVLSLHLEDELEPQMKEIEELEQQLKEKKKQRKALEEQKKAMQDVQDEVDDALIKWEELKDKAEDGEEVFAPKDNNKADKRKRGNKPVKAKKKVKRLKDEDDDFIVSDDEEDSDVDDTQDEDKAEDEAEDEAEDGSELESDKQDSLTMETIDSMIEELKATKKEGREERKRVTREVLEIKSECNDLGIRIKKLENGIAASCILARNNYSTGSLKHQFIEGLRELDLEAAEERGGADFDPEVELRDYDAVAKQFEVHCVSSRGYQNLCGRLKKDGTTSVFQDIELTGIPRLQAACRQITEKGRLASGRKFLTNLSALCNSLVLWSMGDGVASLLSETDKAREVRMLDKKFTKLDDNLDKTIVSTIHALKEDLGEAIYDRYEDAIKAAAEKAITTCERWATKVNRSDPNSPGFAWATYKAVVRRDGGPFSNARGTHDFNSELSEPLIRQLAGPWERVFAHRVPRTIQQYAVQSKEHITTFHKQVQEQSIATGVGVGHINLLAGQLNTYGDIFKHAADEITNSINEAQRATNREFVPTVQRAMLPAYQWCTNESGPGQYIRMKACMHQHISQVNYKMFQDSCDKVKQMLGETVRHIDSKLEETTMIIYQILERDYRAIFGGKEKKFTGGEHGRHEKELKKSVKDALVGFEEPFRALFDDEGPEDMDVEDGESHPPRKSELLDSDGC